MYNVHWLVWRLSTYQSLNYFSLLFSLKCHHCAIDSEPFFSKKKKHKNRFCYDWEMKCHIYVWHIEFGIDISSWFLAALVIHIWAIETNCWCIVNTTIFILWYRKTSKQITRPHYHQIYIMYTIYTRKSKAVNALSIYSRHIGK